MGVAAKELPDWVVKLQTREEVLPGDATRQWEPRIERRQCVCVNVGWRWAHIGVEEVLPVLETLQDLWCFWVGLY